MAGLLLAAPLLALAAEDACILVAKVQPNKSEVGVQRGRGD